MFDKTRIGAPVRVPRYYSFHCRLLLAVVIASAAFSVHTSAATSSEAIISSCQQSDFFYEAHHYSVRKVSIETIKLSNPLEFLFRLQSRLTAEFDRIKALLPLKEGQEFNDAAYSNGLTVLNSEFGELEPGVRIKVVFQLPRVRNCDNQTDHPSLEAVYRVYIVDYRTYSSHTFEGYLGDVTRSLLPGKISKDTGKPLPQPFVGYNRSRSVFGGARGSFNATGQRLGFKKMDFDLSGSQSSAAIDVGIAGERSLTSGAIQNLQWRLGYRYLNIPGNDIRLKESTGLFQFSAATRPRGNSGLVIRFGSSFEFGNDQTNLAAVAPVGSLAQTAYGSLNTFIGVTANAGPNTWKVSYGLKLGEAGKSLRIDYVKHIFDATFRADFLPRPHLPFELDAQVSGGVIQSLGGSIPVAERFFGGNAQKDFIQGMDWQINSSPFIRSIPQNRFNLVGPGSPIGGTRFVSANLTLAQAIWKRPTVPDEVSNNPDARIKLRGQIMSASIATKLSYLTETPQFKALLEKIAPSNDIPSDTGHQSIASDLRNIQALLSLIRAQNPEDPIPDILGEVEPLITDTLGQVAEIRKSPDMGSVRTLVVGFGAGFPSTIEKIISGSEDDDTRGLATLAEQLQNAVPDDPAKRAALTGLKERLIALIGQLESQRGKVAADFEAVKLLGLIQADDLTSPKNKLDELKSALDDIAQQLDDINQQLKNITPPLPPEKFEITNAAMLYTQVSVGAVSRARNSDTDVSYAALKMLVEDTGKITPATLTGLVSSLSELSANLQAMGLQAPASDLNAKGEKLRQFQAAIKSDLSKVRLPDAEIKASRDIAFTGRTLDTIFRRLNLISFGPVAMMDVAWVGPKTLPTFAGTRYGVGAGGRASLVSLNFTVGYSLNLHHRQGEGRGALVFSLDIKDLFR